MADQGVIEVRFARSGLKSGRVALASLTRVLVTTVAANLGYDGSTTSVLYCSLARMQRLNSTHLGLNRPTDVLSFPAQVLTPFRVQEGIQHLGDLAICIPYAAVSKTRGDRALAEELALLIIHGLLHLVGHDHGTREEKQIMWAETRRLLKLPEAHALATLRLSVSR